MRRRLRHLEKLAEEKLLLIPQQNGSIAKFPPSAAEEAFFTSLARLKGNLDIDEHPLSTAAANSPDPDWHNSFVAGTHTVVGGEIPPDLSE
jgi:hypothetical protein